MEKLELEYQQQDFINGLKEQGKSFNTLKNYKTDLNIFNIFLTGKGRELKLTTLTNTEVAEYGEYLKKKYNSPNSIRRRVQALRIFFDFLISKDLYEDNPVKKMLVMPKVVDLPKPTPFFMVNKLNSHLVNIIETTSGHEKLLAQRNLVLFHLIYNGGLKVSDIERLQQKNITHKDDQYRVIVTPSKRDPYSVTLTESFNEAYNTYVKMLESAKNKEKMDFTNLLFNGNPFKILKGGLSSRGIEVIFKEISKSLDFQITAKYLRQACVFKWLSLRVPQSRIKEWMGVQPQYSLKPFSELLKEKPHEYTFMDI